MIDRQYFLCTPPITGDTVSAGTTVACIACHDQFVVRHKLPLVKLVSFLKMHRILECAGRVNLN